MKEDEKMVRVTVRMPVNQRDRLTKRAEKAGVPMAEYVRSLLAKRVLAVEPPDELWPLLENLYSIHDMLLRIRKPEFTEVAQRLEQMILDLQAALTERIMGIVRELRNENIDVIQWTANTQLMITRALNPARISRIDLGEGPEDKIKVYMQAEEVKKGIGKGGCNIKLAGMLVGREIEVWRELPQDEAEEEDVLLSEFTDVIDPWVIERLQAIGCDTARSVLALNPADIASRADLEDETVDEVFAILKSEFEEE